MYDGGFRGVWFGLVNGVRVLETAAVVRGVGMGKGGESGV